MSSVYLGLRLAQGHNRLLGRAIVVISSFSSMPPWFYGLFLIAIFGGVLPTAGMYPSPPPDSRILYALRVIAHTSFSLTLLGVWSGSVVLEVLFNWPGLGQLYYSAIVSLNTGLILGLTVIYAYLLGITLFLLDIANALEHLQQPAQDLPGDPVPGQERAVYRCRYGLRRQQRAHHRRLPDPAYRPGIDPPNRDPGALLCFLEAALAFVGQSDPVLPTWGKIIYDAHVNSALLNGNHYWILLPAVLLLLVSLAFAMLASDLERILNPKLQ